MPQSGFGGLGVSVPAFSTQVRGFILGRSHRIFKGEKILSTPSFGGEVKPSVPCRKFAACKKSLNVAWKSTFRQNYRTFLAHRVPPLATRGLSLVVVGGGSWWQKREHLKLGGTQGCTISGASEVYASGPACEEEEVAPQHVGELTN